MQQVVIVLTVRIFFNVFTKSAQWKNDFNILFIFFCMAQMCLCACYSWNECDNDWIYPKSWMNQNKSRHCYKVSSVRTVFSWPLVGVSSVWVGSRRRQADRLTVMSLDCNCESGVTAQTSDKTLSEEKKKQKLLSEARREMGLPKMMRSIMPFLII